MVFSGVSEPQIFREFMAPSREKSHPLHNFQMPYLKWGKQRRLRCHKVDQNGEIVIIPSDRRSSASEAESDGPKSFTKKPGFFYSSSTPEKLQESPSIGASGKLKAEIEGDDRIEEIKAKLLFHLQAAANKMNFAVQGDGEEEESTAKPWNLRTRRAACKAPMENGGPGIEERRDNRSPSPKENLPKSVRLRGFAGEQSVEKKEKRTFSIPLSREEIREDFMAMTGSRPHRRPKKRAKIIQKQLDSLFPGLWLSEITSESYKVPDFPESGGKR